MITCFHEDLRRHESAQENKGQLKKFFKGHLLNMCWAHMTMKASHHETIKKELLCSSFSSLLLVPEWYWSQSQCLLGRGREGNYTSENEKRVMSLTSTLKEVFRRPGSVPTDHWEWIIFSQCTHPHEGAASSLSHAPHLMRGDHPVRVECKHPFTESEVAVWIYGNHLNHLFIPMLYEPLAWVLRLPIPTGYPVH